jgi:hypothetical protein
MSDGSAACIMKCNFVYSRSGKEEFLEGTYTSKFEKDGLLNKKGDCGGGKVYLRRVANSDFYIEPFLRGKVKPGPVLINKAPVKNRIRLIKKHSPVLVNKAPVKKDTVKAKVSPPVVKKPPVVKNPPVVTKPKPVIRKDTAVLKPVDR